MIIEKIPNIRALHQRTDEVVEELTDLWESSVRLTHTFLEIKAIEALRPCVMEGIKQISKLFCLYTDGQIEAFMGIEGDKVEMLFVHPRSRGRGLGRQLMEYALQTEQIQYVDVNEQNQQAVGFYEHLNFHCFERSELDGQGNPYPILHLKHDER